MAAWILSPLERPLGLKCRNCWNCLFWREVPGSRSPCWLSHPRIGFYNFPPVGELLVQFLFITLLAVPHQAGLIWLVFVCV